MERYDVVIVGGGPAGKPVQAQDEPSGPCGVCRQVMQEFCGPDFEIHMQKAGGGVFTVKLPELLPSALQKTVWRPNFWRFSQKFCSVLIFVPICVIIAYGLEPK